MTRQVDAVAQAQMGVVRMLLLIHSIGHLSNTCVP
jgi:hypothetical protein